MSSLHAALLRLAPLALLAGGALLLGPHEPRWLRMWTLALAIFAGCKWLSWIALPAAMRGRSPARSLAYLLLWPGMDARAFFAHEGPVEHVTVFEVGSIVSKIALGAFLLERWSVLSSPWLAAWVGLLGIGLVLHFGIFHALSALWRRAGVAARALFRSPALATSLAELWGRRWNLAFHRLSVDFVYLPLVPRLGARLAFLTTFLVSGLVHDLVISVPAGGGYGLPTAYFLLQAAGIELERSALGRRLALRGTWHGRVLVVLFAALPAFFLFHPPFLERVVLPFLEALR